MMDDQAGHQNVKGTGPPCCQERRSVVISEAKELITEVLPLLGTLRHQGYWLSDAVLDESAAFGRRVNNPMIAYDNPPDIPAPI